MNFTVDKQTTDDLNLLGKYHGDSIFNLFNKTKTRGGERLLEAMLRRPLTDVNAINERTGVFRYFRQAGYTFPLSGEIVEQFALWLDAGGSQTYAGALVSVARKKILAGLVRDEQYRLAEEGIRAAAVVMDKCHAFITAAPTFGVFNVRVEEIKEILADLRLLPLSQVDAKKLGTKQIGYYEYLLKKVLVKEMGDLLFFIYELDAFISVSAVAEARDFCTALAIDSTTGNNLNMKALRHPALDSAVGNDLELTSRNNLLFLTGANMAGKSTLMKAVGIALYLAHCGFPVAAEKMSFTVKEGLFSSINVPDNISLGYSHFYAEVLRVKQAAQMVSANRSMLVMFDELFKGTNVKDAYEGTLEVTKAFAGYSNCLFIISTHIIEVGEALKNNDNIFFGYMPTVMEGRTPRYLYTLTEGITEDRQGMMIIQNEGILELFK